MQRHPRIFHVSADFPDTIHGDKTRAIQSLVDLAAIEFDQQVWSLNRRNPAASALLSGLIGWPPRPGLQVATAPFPYGQAVTYRAPPKGLLHATMLRQLGDWLAQEIAAGPRPDLIVGHKLAVEGIAVRRASQHIGIPYALSIQGDTDTKILDARPDLTRELSKVFHGAAMVFPFAPWALAKVEGRLGRRSGPTAILPCATDIDEPLPPQSGDGTLLSVFHLKNHRRKNLQGMARAVALLEGKGPAPRLHIIGGGTAADRATCERICTGRRTIELAGPLDRGPLRDRMNRATGFVLPSLRESFGLVFIEALFSGLPIAYPAGTSVDGFFDDAPFAVRMDARDPRSIAAAMDRLIDGEAGMKQALAQWQASAEAQRFTRAVIGAAFRQGLQAALA